MKMLKKYWKWSLLGVIAVLVILFSVWRPVRYPAAPEYIIGSGNCRGEVDTEKYLKISDAFAIGADENGWAVFKNPAKALHALRTHYGKGIRAIQREFHLLPLTPLTYHSYGMYGWQLSEGTKEEMQQAEFVSGFVDIYENSFRRTS